MQHLGFLFLRALWLVAAAMSGLPLVAQAQTEIRFATAYGADNHHTVNLQMFAEEVGKATSGKLTMKVFPGGSLHKPAEIFGAVREGRSEGGEVIMSSLAGESAIFGMDALPFIVSGYNDARHMWAVSRPVVERALAERGIHLLYAVPWQPQNLYSRVPINSVTDFKGLRMRSYNHATERVAQLVRAQPVTIQAVDLTSAIANGQLDLMITSSSTGVESKVWSRMGHYYRVSAWVPKNIVFINKARFDALDESTRKTIAELALRAEERGWKMSEASDREYEAKLAANKVEVSALDFFLRQYLDRIGETLAREWLKQAGPDELQVLLKYTTDRSMRSASAGAGGAAR